MFTTFIHLKQILCNISNEHTHISNKLHSIAQMTCIQRTIYLHQKWLALINCRIGTKIIKNSH